MAIRHRQFSFKDPLQIINMGGPYVATLYQNEHRISDMVLHENIYYDYLIDKVFFIKYHRVSGWSVDNRFTLNFFTFTDNKHYQSKQTFDMLYIDKVAGNNIILYNAFHNQLPDKAFELILDDMEFITT